MTLLLWTGCIAKLLAGKETDDAACDDCDETLGIGEPDPDGYTLDHFPLAGSRVWTYNTVDPGVEWIVEARTRWATDDPTDPITAVDYDTDCEDTDVLCVGSERVRTYEFENTSEAGLRLWSYNEGGLLVDFAPPLPIAVVGMGPDDVLTNIVGGDTWTSTLVGHVACRDLGAKLDLDCLHFVLVNNSGSGGAAAQGDWYLATGVGLAAQRLDFEGDRVWAIESHACLTECE